MRCRRSAASASISPCGTRSRPQNLLADNLQQGCLSEDELDAVRRRRERPVKMTQRMQVVVQKNIISGALQSGDRPLKVSPILRLVTALPWLRGMPASLLVLVARPEHVHSKAARFGAAI